MHRERRSNTITSLECPSARPPVPLRASQPVTFITDVTSPSTSPATTSVCYLSNSHSNSSLNPRSLVYFCILVSQSSFLFFACGLAYCYCTRDAIQSFLYYNPKSSFWIIQPALWAAMDDRSDPSCAGSKNSLTKDLCSHGYANHRHVQAEVCQIPVDSRSKD